MTRDEMRNFAHQSNAMRVIFGPVPQLADEVARLGVERVLILAKRRQARELAEVIDALSPKSIGIFADAAMHTPADVTDAALAVVAEGRADGVVAIGGGSAIGLSKAIALRTNLPQIVVPTTYAGSEMTPILGETVNGVKTTQRSFKVLPNVILYDVDLTLSLPATLSATSGLNAMAHAVEALYADDGNPLVSLMAQNAIEAFARALPKIVENPLDRDARSDALYAAWLCGSCLGAVSMGLHHKLCHVLGGTFGLPHSETHAVILPHAVGYNASAVPDGDAN
jgi:maleylacetate reductase